MNILLIARTTEPSDGWGTLGRTTALGLAAHGHRVEMLVHESDPSVDVPQYAVLPAPLRLIASPFAIFITAWHVWRHVRRQKPDLIHILAEPYAFALLLLPRRVRHPWVITGCGTYTVLPFALRRTAPLLRKVYHDTDHILAISTYTKSRLLKEVQHYAPHLYDTVQNKTSIYTLGIEWPKNCAERQKHPEKRIVFTGAVKARKGVLEIIEACGTFKQQSSVTFRLDIIGAYAEGEYMNTMKDRIRALSIEDAVHFRGHVSDQELSQAYADADLFMMLSILHEMHFEGYGLVFLEANACGVPVIGPDGSGCIDVIKNGVSGFTADPKDPIAVAQAMQRILEHGEIKSDACRQWAKMHSIERQTAETLEIYNQILR